MSAERRLIGCILLNAKQILPTLRGVIKPDDFMDRRYRRIWLRACEMADAGWPTNYRTIVERLAAKQDIADLAKAAADELATSEDWRYYAWLVIERREKISLGIDTDSLLLEIDDRMKAYTASRYRLQSAIRVLKMKRFVEPAGEGE